MRYVLIPLIVACAGCSSSHGGHDDDAGPGGGETDAALIRPPSATCTAPALYDVSTPTATVGTGTPASCDQAALQAAATAGGTIVFDCGAAPVTITVTSAISFANETVLDGGGMVTLSGGGSSRILYLYSSYPVATPRLVVQRLAFQDGDSPPGGDDTAVGGGAIYRNGGSLTVIDCSFTNNHAPSPGQDIAGGAIYGFGGGDTTIVGSTFTNNAASDGGAVGSLNGDLTVINSTFSGNAATGTGGNPGDGGCGGALYMDGTHEATSLCGVTMANNSRRDRRRLLSRVERQHGLVRDGPDDRRQQRGHTDGQRQRGGLYLQGLSLSITNSTISNNKGFYNGGLWISTSSVQMTNDTIAGNTATGSNGGGLWLGHTPTGTILNCTIANNQSTANGQVAGAIFGAGLTLQNTIVAYNTAMYDPVCDTMHTDGGGNLQWPAGSLCTANPLVADPMLGALGMNGATPRRWCRRPAAPRPRSARPAVRRRINAATRARRRAPPAPSSCRREAASHLPVTAPMRKITRAGERSRSRSALLVPGPATGTLGEPCYFFIRSSRWTMSSRRARIARLTSASSRAAVSSSAAGGSNAMPESAGPNVWTIVARAWPLGVVGNVLS